MAESEGIILSPSTYARVMRAIEILEAISGEAHVTPNSIAFPALQQGTRAGATRTFKVQWGRVTQYVSNPPANTCKIKIVPGPSASDGDAPAGAEELTAYVYSPDNVEPGQAPSIAVGDRLAFVRDHINDRYLLLPVEIGRAHV